MKYSQLFTKTSKSIKDEGSRNATLLQKAGYIDQVMAGVYTFLPLGTKVLYKIEQIIREEMDKIATEIFMPSIVPKQLWEQTNRLDSVDVLMKTVPANAAAKAKNDSEYVLNSTHEEVVTPLVAKFARSYKDLPVAVYQIQTKFRNEPRAKTGLLRCREFRMKDLYSFHDSEADLKKYYEEVKKAYTCVFERVGIGVDTLIVLASGGDFTKDYSHEFQTRCESGEDIIFYAKKAGIVFNKEVAPSQAPEIKSDEQLKNRQDVLGNGIIGVEELAKFLKIPIEKTTKTLLFESEKGLLAAAVRGGYQINEEKLKKAAGVNELKLASIETVKKITRAEIGYAGLLNLPENVNIFMDESMKGRKNFEMGANKTNYHSINVNFGRDLKVPEKFYDIKTAKDGDFYPETQEKYEVFAAAEVGNIFPLNIKFSKAFDYYYTDEKGQKQPVFMGCYGIGSSRIMGVLVEKFADEKGLIWPKNLAPFQVYLIGLGIDESETEKIYQELLKNNIEALWDDRAVSPGVKFADCDLLGIPIRLVISKKTNGKIEVKERTKTETRLMSIEEVIIKAKL